MSLSDSAFNVSDLALSVITVGATGDPAQPYQLRLVSGGYNPPHRFAGLLVSIPVAGQRSVPLFAAAYNPLLKLAGPLQPTAFCTNNADPRFIQPQFNVGVTEAATVGTG